MKAKYSKPAIKVRKIETSSIVAWTGGAKQSGTSFDDSSTYGNSWSDDM